MATASLPMYDFAELTDAHDALWAAVVEAHGDGLPATLTHADDVHALWHATDLAVSQACGWPLVDELDGRVRLIGAFSYDVPDAIGPRYRSRIVTRPGPIEPAAAVAAVNSFASLSGWLSLVGAFPEVEGSWPGDVTVTGAHVHSLAALQAGEADVAAIDGVTYALRRAPPAAVARRTRPGRRGTAHPVPAAHRQHRNERRRNCVGCRKRSRPPSTPSSPAC